MMKLVHNASLKKNGCRYRPSIFSFAMMFLLLGTVDLEAALFSGLSHPAWEAGKAAEALAAGRLEEAEAALLRAQQRQPDLPELSYNLGIVKYRKRQYEQAVGEFERASATSDTTLKAAALYNQGNCFYRLHEWERAIKSYTDSLNVQEDQKTRFNLEQAQKKLREQMQREQNQQGQSSPQQQQNQDRQMSQNDQQQQNDRNQQSESGSSEGNDQQKQQQQQNQQQNQSGSDGQKKDGQQQQSQPNGEQQQNASGTQRPGDDQQQQSQASATPAVPPTTNGTDSKNVAQPPQSPQIGSDVASIPESLASGPVTLEDTPQNTRDLQMGSDTTPLARDASERARQLKNAQINPYLVDRILKQMEDREKEVQQRLRRDPKREESLEDMDPFFMSPDQLRNFFERRRNPQPRKSTPDQPDW